MENNTNAKGDINPKYTQKYIITRIIFTLLFVIILILIYRIISQTSDTFEQTDFYIISNEVGIINSRINI